MKLTTKNLKVPAKSIKVKVLDTEMEIDVNPISGFGLMKLQKLFTGLQKDPENYDLQVQTVRLALKNGAKAQEEDINFLIENDMMACLNLTKQILQYSSEYNKKKIEQTELAKKKSQK